MVLVEYFDVNIMIRYCLYVFIIIFLPLKAYANTPLLLSEQNIALEEEMIKVLSLLEPVVVSTEQSHQPINKKIDHQNSNTALLAVLYKNREEYDQTIENFEVLKSKILAEKKEDNVSLKSKFQINSVDSNNQPNEFDQIILNAAHKYQLDYALIKAIVHVESHFNLQASSPVGAQGLMQLMPATAKRFNVKNPFDAYENIHGGTQYLSWLLKKFNGNLAYTLAAYNAGEGNVQKYGGIPPFKETQLYVVKVLEIYKQFR